MSVRTTNSDSLAGVDEILSRGDRADYLELIRRIMDDPSGSVADAVMTLYQRRVGTADPEFYAVPQYEAAFRLVLALREFPDP